VSDDHLLSRIPGGYIAQALIHPPSAKAADGAIMESFVNVPGACAYTHF